MPSLPRLWLVAVPALALGQAKKALTVDDYSRWRGIGNQSISGDGKWVTYVLSQTNTAPADAKPVLHLLRLDTNQDLEIAERHGAGVLRRLAVGRVSDRSRLRRRGGRGGRGGGGGGGDGSGGAAPAGQRTRADASAPPAPPRRVELRNLATGAVQSWQDMQSFTFAATSSHLAAAPSRAGRRRARRGGRGGAGGGGGAPGGGAGGGAAAEPTGPRGADVILHDLATGHDQLLGSVGEISFNKKGDLLAYTVDAAPRDGNGLFVLDLRNGRVNPLDNDARVYSRLTWNDDGTGLAVLKGVDVDKMRERDNMLLVYPERAGRARRRRSLAGQARSGEGRRTSRRAWW